MELTAVIEGLAALREPCRVVLTSDSRYVVDGIQRAGPVPGNGTAGERRIKRFTLNADLWDRLLTLLDIHEVTFVWVHGHQGHPENERCDRLAVAAYEQYKR